MPRKRSNASSRPVKRPPAAVPAKLPKWWSLVPGYDPCAGKAVTEGGCWFDLKAANLAIDFFAECLSFTTGQWMGEPFVLQPWQQAIVGHLFGWKRADGTRRYREAFIYVPRKCGKSELAGGLGNYLAFADNEPGAQVYCAAADREQAKLVFNAAKTMVLNEPLLTKRAYLTQSSITVPETSSCLKVISAEAYSKHGFNSHGVIIDELHAQPNRELVDVLVTSTAARRQPLIIYITTADFDRESICNEKYDYAGKVRDGVIDDPAFLPVIYECTKDEDWTSPVIWRKANPNLGISVSEEYLTRECQRAQDSAAYENTFKRLHLNLRTEQDVRWLSLSDWDDSAGEPITIEDLAKRPCMAGLDLSTTTDITALSLVFPDPDEESVIVLPYFWIPENGAQKREQRDRVPYLTWARQGHITMTPGDVVDYAVIRQKVNELSKIFDIRELAIDRWNSTHDRAHQATGEARDQR